MKKILLKFYCRQNAGDDLFVRIFSDYFSDCKINLISNPFKKPKGLKSHVKIHPISLLNTATGKLLRIIGWKRKISLKIESKLNNAIYKVGQKHDASVMIGGSIFMDAPLQNASDISFTTDLLPDFTINSTVQPHGNLFLIGANFGPVYTDGYWSRIRNDIMKYTHVTLRDYSSYQMVKDIPHVQYAPDVVFMCDMPKRTENCENVIISVIDIERRTANRRIVEAYYNLLSNVVSCFTAKGTKVTLASFCEREGDEKAIDILIKKIKDPNSVSIYRYKSNTDELLTLFANASFVIASRFHSLILGLLAKAPVFPISYNCKTKNYLTDLHFTGNYATLEDLPSTTCDDIIYNYENNIITDCSSHIKHAENQFWGVKQVLQNNS